MGTRQYMTMSDGSRVDVTNTDTVQVKGLELEIGNLKIRHQTTEGPRVGFMTEVFINGQELKNVVGVDLKIRVDQVVTATIEYYP